MKSQFIEKTAKHYLTANEDTVSPSARAEFARLVNQRHRHIINLGIREERVDDQPYHRAEELFKDVDKKRVIRVSTQFNDPVVLSKEDNLKYRLVHDFDHFILGAEFDWEGEVKTCHYFQSFTKSDVLRRILRSELLYQAAACLYLGNFPETQKLVLSDPN